MAELSNISDLKPAPYNPRQISPEAFTGLKHSLMEFGDISGLVWNQRTGNLVCGHQRLKGLQEQWGDKLRLDNHTVTCPNGDRYPVRVVDWEKAKEQAANITANNTLLAGEFTTELGPIIDKLMDELPDFTKSLRLDKVAIPQFGMQIANEQLAEPDKQDKIITELGDLWLLGGHRLLCGDCAVTELSVVPSLPNTKLNMSHAITA